MIYTIWYNLITTYRNYAGTGAILVLFVVGVAFLSLGLTKEGRKSRPYIFVLSVWGTIGYALSKVIFADIKEENRKKITAVRSFIVVMCLMAVVLSGKRILSPAFYTKAENNMHIYNDLKETMDYVLSDMEGDEAKIVVMPGFGNYFSAYSSKFSLMYEDPIGEDISAMSEDAREIYMELGKREPDMWKISKTARTNGYRYIAFKDKTYWSDIPITEVGYELLIKVGDWEVYKAVWEVSEL